MTAVITAFSLINIAVLILTISLAVVYLIPVLLIRRFHNTNNVYTANICFATICCCSYWLFFYIALEFYPQIISGIGICVVLNYFGMMCTFQVPLAVVGASFNRVRLVVYTKRFSKKKPWPITCLIGHWVLGFIFSVPQISFNEEVRIFYYY